MQSVAHSRRAADGTPDSSLAEHEMELWRMFAVEAFVQEALSRQTRLHEPWHVARTDRRGSLGAGEGGGGGHLSLGLQGRQRRRTRPRTFRNAVGQALASDAGREWIGDELLQQRLPHT